MANTDRPRGAIPIRRLDGGACLPANPYSVDASNATAIFIGDFVKLEADGNVAPAAAGDRILGVCMGVLGGYDNLGTRHLAATTAGDILVNDDPDTISELQEDDGGTALTAAARGALTDIVAGAGSATTGISAHELNQDAVEVTSGQLRLLRLVNRENNAYGDNADWEVMVNEHEFTQTAGV